MHEAEMQELLAKKAEDTVGLPNSDDWEPRAR